MALQELRKVDNQLGYEVRYNSITENVLEQYNSNKDIPFMDILRDEIDLYEVDFDDYVDYLNELPSLKTKFAKIMASQGYDRGLYNDDELSGLF